MTQTTESLTIHELNQQLTSVLSQIVSDLPTRRDWLDPALEERAKALLNEKPDQSEDHWYIVQGRECGDDEDTSMVIRASSQETAINLFFDEVVTHEHPSEAKREEAKILNAIWDCGVHEPKSIG